MINETLKNDNTNSEWQKKKMKDKFEPKKWPSRGLINIFMRLRRP